MAHEESTSGFVYHHKTFLVMKMKIKGSLLMRILTVKRFWRVKIGWVT